VIADVAFDLRQGGHEPGILRDFSGSVQPQGKITTNKNSFSMIEYLRKTTVDWVKFCCEIEI